MVLSSDETLLIGGRNIGYIEKKEKCKGQPKVIKSLYNRQIFNFISAVNYSWNNSISFIF